MFLEVICNNIDLLLESILLEVTSCFRAHNFEATIMDASTKTSMEPPAHAWKVINGIIHGVVSACS